MKGNERDCRHCVNNKWSDEMEAYCCSAWDCKMTTLDDLKKKVRDDAIVEASKELKKKLEEAWNAYLNDSDNESQPTYLSAYTLVITTMAKMKGENDV